MAQRPTVELRTLRSIKVCPQHTVVRRSVNRYMCDIRELVIHGWLKEQTLTQIRNTIKEFY